MIMTRRITIVCSLVVVAVMTGYYVSIYTLLKTNQDASTTLVTTINDRAGESLDAILAQTRKNSEATDTLLKNVQSVSVQARTLAEQNKTLGEQNKSLGQQTLEMSQQLKELQQENQKLLQEHTQIFQATRVSAKRAASAAEESSLNSKRAIRQLQPKPNFLQRWFASPTPAPGHRR